MAKAKLKENKLIDEILFSIDDVKGVDINLMDLTKISNTVCGFFIICTNSGTSYSLIIYINIFYSI
jgi:ribosome-associated protein